MMMMMMISVMMDDEREKKDDGILEHKGMATRYAYLSYLIDQRRRRRNIFPATKTIAEYRSYLILKRPTIHQFHQSYLF